MIFNIILLVRIDYLYPLDSSKIKGLRGCKKEMLSKESGHSARFEYKGIVLLVL